MEKKRKSRNCRRPGFWLTTKTRDKTSWVEFLTYRELKKKLREYIQYNDIPQLTVFRQKRGEWGECFETWQLQGDELIIIKEGWM